MKLLFWLLILSVPGLAQAEAIGLCSALILKGPVKAGSPETSIHGLSSEFDYRFLGRGQNGSVYRGTNKSTGETIVVKKYTKRDRFISDLEAFEHVDRLKLPHGRMVDVLDYDEENLVIFLEDVPGYSLEDLRANPELTTPEILANANAQYTKFREEVRAALEAKGAHVSNSTNGYLFAGIYEPSKRKWVEFKLWYDQVILDARTLELVWVDPF